MSMDHQQDPNAPFAEAGLDALFAEARAAPPAPLPPAFEARLVAAALAARPAPRPGFLARLRASLAEIGGAPSLAGVGAAGLAGVWIGFAAPGPTADLVSSFWQGAASVTPAAASWASTDAEVWDIGGTTLLSLISGDIE